MKYTALQIAELLGGKIQGDRDLVVTSISRIEEGKEGTLTFLSNPKYTRFLYSTKASVAIVSKDLVLEKPVKATLIFFLLIFS